ncbi:TetR/AcrR family transcriptional regulator [Geobacter pickeringii]|uniref:TetR family transcriptional regulator n=1 Tax=Geobacter pickeringii TaxID=345632 RepID=A0A0B5BAP6_9BACT|nr:TetR/AcrR family transcriptional regulator [Geobacter pickeringii]AJE03652.1 TetR family transcriptional regulator [Geobacter pickeringii]
MKTKGEMTRAKILEAARELFNVKGFTATSINDLVAATGMQKGSIYFHFPGKEAIACEVLKDASDQFMAFLGRALGGDNPGASIDNFFRCALDKHLATGFVGGCIFGNTALEMGDSDPEFAGMIDQVFDEWISRVASVVTEAQKRGQIRTDIRYDALAKHIIATVEGGIMMSRLKKDERPMRECLDALRITLDLQV